MSQTAPRRSLGGRVVEDGLRRAGFSTVDTPGTVLVETARPQRERFQTVLAQNAWNVVDGPTFRQLLRRYPPGKWPTYAARRAVAQVNVRRAERVVCLTDAMAEMCSRFSSCVEVSPLTVPRDFLEHLPDADGMDPGTLLVPGTVTWHKNPLAALDIARALPELSISRVCFAGSDDGSGAWKEVKSAAAAAGIAVSRRTLDRAEMRTACATADAVAVPSHLESLSFSLAESLLHAPVVVASPIPAHREVAARVGRSPHWWESGRLERSGPQPPPLAGQLDGFVEEWRALGECLRLPPATARSRS